ncbi:MAG TPA: YbaB/EbfC family nucleoid-associated protein [Candidatus Paceibacterota bacterium]|nr:YbaB/EbfC family nucleoid-associated protein [Candidatus Paceibacterota bacterium]
MFDQLKKIQELKKLQDSMKQERETVEKKGVSVTVNGAMEVLSITLNPSLEQAEAENVVRECINDAMRNIQKRLAKTMLGSGLGGF